ETNPFGGQTVEVRRSDRRGAVAAEIRPAQVVGEDEEHVRRSRRTATFESVESPSDCRGAVRHGALLKQGCRLSARAYPWGGGTNAAPPPQVLTSQGLLRPSQAFSAPAPVRERTSISLCLSSRCSFDNTVPNQPRKNDTGIDTRPGFCSGNQWKSTLVIIDFSVPDTAGENTISTRVTVRPP